MSSVGESAGPARGWVDSRPATVLLSFVLLAALLFRRAWTTPSGKWIGWPGDPPLHMWFLKWTPWAVAHGHNPLFTKHINVPDGVNLMWNTAEPLTALAVSPITFLFGTVFAYNVVITLGVALSGWCAYLFLRGHVRHEAAAVVGGLLYGFSPFVMSQALTHSNLVQVFIPPLLLMAVEEIVVRQRRSYRLAGAVLGLLLAVQLLITEELVIYEILAISVGTLVVAMSHWREVAPRVPHVLRAVAVGAVVCGVLAGGPVAFQFFGPQRVTNGILQGPEIRSSDLLSFVVPTELQQVNPMWTDQVTSKFSDSCCKDEWGSYLGVPLIMLLIVSATLFWRRSLVRAAAVVAVLFLVLSMGPHLHVGGYVSPMPLPFRVLEKLPLLQNVQPRRLMLFTFLGAAVLVAVLVDELFKRKDDVAVAVAGTAALIVALVPVLPTFQYPASEVRLPSFFTSSQVERLPKGGVALIAPFARNTSTSEPMLWQAEADFRWRMPEGYILGPDDTGRFVFLPEPSSLSEAMGTVQGGGEPPPWTPDARARYGRDLSDKHVRSIVVGPMLYEANLVAFFSELLGRPPERVGGVSLWLRVDGRAITRAASRAPALPS